MSVRLPAPVSPTTSAGAPSTRTSCDSAPADTRRSPHQRAAASSALVSVASEEIAQSSRSSDTNRSPCCSRYLSSMSGTTEVWVAATVPCSAMRSDFWKFWFGETVSSFGSSITQFALPLLVFKLTGSAVSLGLGFAMFGLPHLLFGLLIGAWTDRLDRKRLMIVVDLLSAAVLLSVPLAATAGVLSVWWIYMAIFISSTLGIFFQAAQFAAIPSLVEREELVAANGRIQASFSAATVLGPLVAGGLLAFIPIEDLLYVDAATFLVSAVTLSLIARPFNAPREAARTSIRADVIEGLRYVLRHPVLRNISAMMAIINFISVTVYAQIVLFAKQRFAVTDSELGLLFAANGAGVVLLSLAAGPLRSRFTFGNVALGSLM